MIFPQPLTPDGVEHIATHKYVGGKYTPLDNVLNPFWFWATEHVPMWMAPNLITMLGLMCNVAAFILFWTLSPSFGSDVEPWVFYFCALMVWLYQTLDAMDGKQARRTGSSTPAGLHCLPMDLGSASAGRRRRRTRRRTSRWRRRRRAACAPSSPPRRGCRRRWRPSRGAACGSPRTLRLCVGVVSVRK